MSIPKIRWTTLAILSLALILRVLLLAIKPPHFDEGVNGWFVDQMTRTGYYHYDPTNYHGPLHFYVLFISQTLLGRNLWALRLPLAMVSFATVYLLLLFEPFTGRRASELAALAMAVSPGAVFYGRYAIHESWLVFFLILTLFGVVGMWRLGTKAYLWCLMLGIAGMILTKETYIIHLASFILAAICLCLLEKVSPSENAAPAVPQRWSGRDLCLSFITLLVLILFFYSGAFLDFKSLRGLFQTYVEWFHTGEKGNGHEKALYYWFYPLIVRYEWTTVAAVIGSFYFILPRTDRLFRFIAIYGCGALTAYSIIPYKTPWCIISLLWPFFFVFAHLADKLLRRLPRATIALVSILLCGSLVWTIRLNFFRYTDDREPYVYVQTLKDVYKMVNPLNQLATRNPENYHMDIHIILSSYHPLPWLLGDFTHVGYYDDDRKPDHFDADCLIVEDSRVEEVEKSLHDTYFTETIRLRSSQERSKLYFNVKRFGSLFPTRKPGFTPDVALF